MIATIAQQTRSVGIGVKESRVTVGAAGRLVWTSDNAKYRRTSSLGSDPANGRSPGLLHHTRAPLKLCAIARESNSSEAAFQAERCAPPTVPTRGGVHGKTRFERAGWRFSHPHFRVAYLPHLRRLNSEKSPLSLVMMDFPDGTLRRERAVCREELELAQRRYTDSRNPETRAAYMRALKRFADLVVYRKLPELPEDVTTRHLM
jgi:hypothetical protein